jgi:hypothetical protein
MTPEQFTYWLQGYVEIAATRTAPTSDEWNVIKDHLALVFDKQTPDRSVSGQGSQPIDWTKLCEAPNSPTSTPDLPHDRLSGPIPKRNVKLC